MSLQSILALARPTGADALKVQVTKSLETAAEAVYAEGMTIPDDSDDLEEEKTMWVTRWERVLVCGGVIRIGDETDVSYQRELESCLRKAREHGVEARIAGHVALKMQEANPTYIRWHEEATARREAEERRAEETRRAAPSVSFKPTGLLGGATAADKGKGKDRPLVHAPNARMSVTQRKVSIGSPCCCPD